MHQLGIVEDPLRIEHVEILIKELPDAHPLLATGASPAATTSSGSIPSCRALASTARTSAANARVGKARSSASGH